MRRTGKVAALLVFATACGLTFGDGRSSGNELLQQARTLIIEEIQKQAKDSKVHPVDSIESELSIVLNKSNKTDARIDSILSLAISELPEIFPVEKLAELLADPTTKDSIRDGVILLFASIMHQNKHVETVETHLYRLLNSSSHDEEVRVAAANLLLHYGSSSHALARNVSKAMTEPSLSGDSVESLGMILFSLSAAYERISTDETLNWMLARLPSEGMSELQKMKYFAAIGLLEDHARLSDSDHLESQTILDMQLYFEKEFSDARNPEKIRGLSVTFIKNPEWIQDETVKAAQLILKDHQSPDSLKRDASKILNLVEK